MSLDDLQQRLARHVSGVAMPREPEFTPLSPGGRHPRELEIRGVPVVIVDPHNEAFYYWALARRGLQEAPTLIHVDSHSDMGFSDVPFFEDAFNKPIEKAEPTELWEYTQRLDIAQFIESATGNGLIKPSAAWFDPWADGGNLHWYSHRGSRPYGMEQVTCEELRYGHLPSVESRQRLKTLPTILDIDLDAFSLCNPGTPENMMDIVEVNKRISRTDTFLRHCGKPVLVTIAESQTPETYCPPQHLEYVTERTLEILDEVLR